MPFNVVCLATFLWFYGKTTDLQGQGNTEYTHTNRQVLHRPAGKDRGYRFLGITKQGELKRTPSDQATAIILAISNVLKNLCARILELRW